MKLSCNSTGITVYNVYRINDYIDQIVASMCVALFQLYDRGRLNVLKYSLGTSCILK